MRNSLLTAVLLLPLVSPPAFARYTEACFTRDEVRVMAQKRDTFSSVASSCLKSYWTTHVDFYSKNRYSKYFGNRNADIDTVDKRMKAILFVLWPNIVTSKEFRAFEADFHRSELAKVARNEKAKVDSSGFAALERWLQKHKPAAYRTLQARKPRLQLEARAQEESGGPELRPNSSSKLQNVSCIDMTRRCLQAGFQAIGLDEAFRKIDKVVLRRAVSGLELQKALADLGWSTLYFNPDTSKNTAWDAEDRKANPLPPPKPGDPKPLTWVPTWGDHAFLWSGYCQADGTLRPGKKLGGVLCSNHYTLTAEPSIPIDNKRLLVNFGTRVPRAFQSVPFFVGTAHKGYHVFPGFYGQVIEAHSMKALRAKINLEKSVFNPLDQANGGGPRWTSTEIYRSGVIVVPPGYLGNALGLGRDIQMDGDCVDLRPQPK